MRTAFIDTLCDLAATDERLWLLTGDLGYSVLEPFAQRFPSRFLNVGVAEQNMTGVAAGLALAGKVVFTYSIANFPIFRCLEQIRNDICYHRLNVKITAIGGGLAYGAAGYTHHGVEDLAVMSSLPHITVAAPSDPVETALVVRALASHAGPAFLRLGKAGEPVVHKSAPDFQLGKMIPVRIGGHATLISTGGMLRSAVEAAELLEGQRMSVDVLSCPTVVPLDIDTLLKRAEHTRCIVTIEEHGPGGLGTRVGEALARAGLGVRFIPIRLAPECVCVAGSQEYLRSSQGLAPDAIARQVLSLRGQIAGAES